MQLEFGVEFSAHLQAGLSKPMFCGKDLTFFCAQLHVLFYLI